MSTTAEDQPIKEPSKSFLERLADRLGMNASAAAVYHEPVERDGTTIIPVAKVRWGFGGGGGKSRKERGMGAGGGVHVSPLGYIEMRGGETQFKPIRDPVALVPVVVVAGAAGWVLLRALRKLIRG